MLKEEEDHMGSNITVPQAAIAGVLAAVGVAWSKIGWLIALWAACTALDFVSGWLAAWRAGKWSSRIAHEGIWHKAGMLVIVLVAMLFDLVLREIIRVVDIQLPIEGVLVTPLVLSWYAVTELGSIVENAVRMGAQNVPVWLRKGLGIASDAVDKAGETAAAMADEVGEATAAAPEEPDGTAAAAAGKGGGGGTDDE